MNRYQTETPHVAIGLAALALTALTIALAVLAPASLDSRSAGGDELAAVRRNAQVPIEVAIIPSRIDVIAIRTPDIAEMRVHGIQVKAKPQG